MADKVTIEGNYPTGEVFKFTLDGASTYDQMQRLIDLTGSMASKISKRDPEELKRIDELKAGTVQYQKNRSALNATSSGLFDLDSALTDVKGSSSLVRGDFKGLSGALRGLNTPLSLVGTAASSLVGALMGYAESLRPALQRGIGGAVMDFAIYAKSAGMSMDSFTKALASTEGAFGMLGATQNEAAKNFSGLINSVRTATAATGNLGMNNEELAKFTAEQLKIAVQQGARGKVAQDRVINTSKELGEQFQELAQRTGKSITELAQYASKLVMDPTINNYIATLSSGGSEVSKAMQKFGSTMGALFGKQGEELANVAARTAVSGFPMFTEEMGKQLYAAMPAVAREIETMSRKAAQGYEPTPEDQARLKRILEEEYEKRQRYIRLMGMSSNAEDRAAAARIEQMYQQSRMYDEAQTKKRKEEADAAQKYNAQVNELTAKMHQLMVPLLQVLNAVDWNFMFDMLNGFAKTVETVMKTVFEPIAHVLGDTGGGKVLGALLGLATIAGTLGVAFVTVRNAAMALASVFRFMTGRGAAGAGGKGVLDDILGGGGKAPGGAPGGPAGPGKGPGGAPGSLGDLARREQELAAARAAEQEKLKARSAELYKKYRDEGLTATEAKRRADAHAAYQPDRTLGERLEAAKNSETAGRVKNFVKDWGPTIGLMMAGYAGSKLEQAGEERLKEDPNSVLGQMEKYGGKVLDFAGTWGSTIMFTTQIMKDYFPDALEKVKGFGSGVWDIAKKTLPGTVEKLETFGKSLGTWSTGLMNSPLLSALGSAATTYAISAIGGMAIDAALNKLFGVGNVQITEKDKKQDEANWQRMTGLEKAESGFLRTIETVGKFFGLSNMVKEAEAARIKNETEYFAKKDLETTGATAAQAQTKAEKEQLDQLKILNQHMEDMKDSSKATSYMSSRQVMTAEEHSRFLRQLTMKPN